MKKRNILFGIICLLMLFTLTGCGNKKAITTTDFITISEKEGYMTTDAKNQFETYDYVKEVTIASGDGYQVEFYVLEDETYANSLFNTNKTTFESYKESSSIESSSSMGNYSSYTLTSGGKYMHICRVDNTFLYLNVDEAYKNNVKDFVKKLGY